MTPADAGKKSGDKPWHDGEQASRAWGLLLFGLIGATATTLAVSQLRRTVDWFYTQLSRSQSSCKNATSNSHHRAYREEAWNRYNRRMQEEYEEEIERVERIRRMQNVFNRERNKYKKSYESWREYGPGAYQYQHFQRDDWYWQTDTSYKDQRTNFKSNPRDDWYWQTDTSYKDHYSVLGLDRSRAKVYSEAEIKSAFRAKAKKYHPDQNPNNKETAEAKFKEVMVSYEAIKSERKNTRC